MSSNARKVPYGWRDEGGKLVKEPAQQMVIKEIFEMKAGKMSHTMIARALQERREPTQRGGKWHKSTVGKIVARDSEAQSVANALARA